MHRFLLAHKNGIECLMEHLIPIETMPSKGTTGGEGKASQPMEGEGTAGERLDLLISRDG